MLEKGFTLVELMIVIVIVGILSAVALPNFLSQTSKAKATEAKTLGAAAMKEGQVAWTESGLSGLAAWDTNQCPKPTDTFSFECDYEEILDSDGTTIKNVYAQVTATGNNDAGDLKGRKVIGQVDVMNAGEVIFCGDAVGLDACTSTYTTAT